MPHAVIEYSNNLASAITMADPVRAVHDVMIQSGLFSIDSIKTRAIGYDSWMVGEKGQNGSFVYLCVSLLSGRTVEQRQTLSDNLLKALGAVLPADIDQVTVEIREMDKETYRKIK